MIAQECGVGSRSNRSLKRDLMFVLPGKQLCSQMLRLHKRVRHERKKVHKEGPQPSRPTPPPSSLEPPDSDNRGISYKLSIRPFLPRLCSESLNMGS